MAHEGMIAKNIKKGMADWSDYIIREDLLPVCMVTIKQHDSGQSEVAFLKGPTIDDDRVKEYLEFLLNNWDHFKQV